MIASHAANKATFKVTTPSDCEIRLTRLFNAPRHLVFEAMTRPEHVRRWWGNLGEGYSVPVCEIDLRVDGSVAFRQPPPEGRGRLLRQVPRDRAAKPPGLHRGHGAVPGTRVGCDHRVHRGKWPRRA